MAKALTGPKTVPRTSLNALSKDRKTVRKKRWTMRYRKRRKQDLLCRHRRVCSIDAADPRERYRLGMEMRWHCDEDARHSRLAGARWPYRRQRDVPRISARGQ
jgi:alkylated DNA repair dioxygenase AlkB